MFRKIINTSLLILLVLVVVFSTVSCEKLKISNLRANHHFTNANTQFTDGKFRLAIEEYEKALSYNPGLIQAYRFLGESYKSLYKPGVEDEKNAEFERNALEALTKAYEIDPTNKGVIHSLGDMYDKMRNFEEAEKLYLRILEMEPTNMSNYYVVAEFYKRYSGNVEEGEEGDNGVKTPFQKAEEMYLRRIETDPANAQGYAYIAQFYDSTLPMPEFDKAVFYHKKRIGLDPDDAEAWLAVGVNRSSKAYRIQSLLSKQQRIDLATESEAALKKAIELNDQDPNPYAHMSVLYKSVLAKLYPENAQRYNDQADIYAQRFQDLGKRAAEKRKLEKELVK
ncbi:MAG: tetratricopeptide repeat protein [Candidatus Aminicenantes bacterium]|nr:tetratricopeptide repeat protein [Candidatus Aminicenantes bacterium]